MPIKIVAKKNSKKDPFRADKTESLDKEFSKSVSKANKKAMKNVKKKPVIKKGIGKMLETISPVYSIMKGKGPISEIASSLGGSSLIGNFAQRQQDKAKKRRMAMAGANKMDSSAVPQSNRMTPMTQMMAGGPVKRKRSIDGCAMRGKTRAV